MALTSAQQTTLKAAILADSELNALPNTLDGAFTIAVLLNQTAVPDFWVWRTNVSTQEIRSVLVWSEYDTLSVSRQNAFSFLCSNHIVDASLVNVRQGIQSIFQGPQQAGNLAALVAIGKRLAKRGEKLLATGTGSNASPATMTFEGNLTFQDVFDARNS